VLTKKWLAIVHSLSASEEVLQLSTSLPSFSLGITGVVRTQYDITIYTELLTK